MVVVAFVCCVPWRQVALLVAECLDKIRINPGNFADGRKSFEDILYEVGGGVAS